MTKDNNFKIAVFHSFDDVESLWRTVEKTGDCFAFQTFDWLKNWYAFIGKETGLQLCIVTVEYPSGQPLILLPLGIQRRCFVSCLVWLGGDLSDYHGPLLSKDYSNSLVAVPFDKLWSDIRTRLPPHNAVDLQKQPEFIGGQKNPFLCLPRTPHPSSAHFTQLVGPIDSFIKSKRSNRWIQGLRRKQRRLQGLGELEFIVATKEQDIERFLSEMISQKAMSYNEMGVVNLFKKQGYLDFFYHMSRHYHDNSFVQLCALTLNNQILATHWGLIYKKRFYHLFPAYARNEFTRYSPGIILFRNMFKWGIEHGIEISDFTVGDEPYKYDWCDHELRLYDHLKATTARGLLYVAPVKLQRLLKRKIKQTPILFSIAKYLRKWIAPIRFGR